MDSYLNQYTVGGLAFAVGLYFAARQGYVGLGGLMFFMVLQGYLQFAPMAVADALAHSGDGRGEKMIGEPIDFAIMGGYLVMILLIGMWLGRLDRAGIRARRRPSGDGAEECLLHHGRVPFSPRVFGLILAALTAALTSTVDTLITAVSAVTVNDVYKPFVNPRASEKQLLRTARFSAVGVTLLGIAMETVFMQFKTIYAAHGAMTAAITPPLVVALLPSVFWRRYTAKAALATIVGGLLAIGVSVSIPEIIRPFAHGVPMDAGFREAGDGLFARAKHYNFMRALFGLGVSAAIGVVVTFFTRPEPSAKQAGLVWSGMGNGEGCDSQLQRIRGQRERFSSAPSGAPQI